MLLKDAVQLSIFHKPVSTLFNFFAIFCILNMLGLTEKQYFAINYKSSEEIRKCIYILGKGRTQTSLCHLLVRIWLL